MTFNPAELDGLRTTRDVPFRIRKIGHVVLRTSNLRRSVDFYAGILGFAISDIYPDEMVPGGIEAQTRQTLKNVEKALALAGCTLKDVVKSTVWLDDARDFWTFNRVYAEFFSENKPARSTTQAKLMIDAKVEIEVIAYKA